jgi:lipopolysaccharide/colanic/teichoic acid biosynthesis glycosyltransferase
VKRLLDLVIASLGLVVVLPVFALVTIAIKLTSPGPVLFRQTRVGQFGKPFTILKFRTMREHSDTGARLTVGDDLRFTRVGKLLRRLKVDELPQLLNVVRGEMSLVGPRPELPEYVELYSKRDARLLLSVRPGITGAASVAFPDESVQLDRSDDPVRAYVQEFMPKKLELERSYIENWSLRRDLELLVRTAVALVGRGS